MRAVVLVPVYVGEAPEEGVVAKLLGHLQFFHIVLPLGRAVKLCHLLSCDLFIGCFHTIQLFPEGLQSGDPGHIGVGGGVVAYDVSFLLHPADQVRVLRDKIAHHKKGGGGLVLFQCIQDGLRVAVLIACVKGQVDPLFICVAQIVGVVLRQLLGGGVSHRGLALLLEAKAPVPLRGGLDRSEWEEETKEVTWAAVRPRRKAAARRSVTRRQGSGFILRYIGTYPCSYSCLFII